MKNDWSASTLLSNTPILLGDNTIPGQKLPKEIKDVLPVIYRAVDDFGLDYYPTDIEWMTYDGISEMAAYGGFPQRIPHWRHGMSYEELSKGYEFGFQRIFEMVVNTNPCVMYLLDSNTFTDNITVIPHALFHNDFFKNNIFFKKTNTKMMNEFGNNRTRVLDISDRWGEDRVESFIDDCYCIESLIDPSSAWLKSEYKDPVIYDEREYEFPRRLHVSEGHDYMEEWVNPDKWIDDEWNRIKLEEKKKNLGIIEMYEKDILKFILEYAPLKPWEQAVLSIIYNEAIYFAPQAATKVLNEGWACLLPGSLIYTDRGLLKIDDIISEKMDVKVFDGKKFRKVTNWFQFDDKKAFKIKTKRGYEISGSDTHKIYFLNGWKQLKDCVVGDKIKICAGGNKWSGRMQPIKWKPYVRMTAKDCCEKFGVTYDLFKRFKCGSRIRKNIDKVKLAIKEYDESLLKACGKFTCDKCKCIKIPKYVTKKVATFLGFLVGDGHISEVNREIGFTNGEEFLVDLFVSLSKELFDLDSNKKWDDSSLNGRWRVRLYSKELESFLKYLGFPTGVCARIKKVPDIILSSPKKVVSAFLRAYLDSDGCVSDEGSSVILSSSSLEMIKQVQVLLLNYGILSSISKKDNENYHLVICGESVKLYYQQIGFNSPHKQERLCKAVYGHPWFNKQNWIDEIETIEELEKTSVYDITVEDTHRYAAQGFMNHNSYGDFKMMTEWIDFSSIPKFSIVEYADHKSQTLGGKNSNNPYKLGFELFMDIEDRWNKGRFGREFEKCEDNQRKENWDLKLNLGHQKVFEVREVYNDVTAIAEFFTEEFCRKHNFFNWEKFNSAEPGVEAEYRLVDRDWKRARNLLIQRYLNRGLPDIRLVDPDGKGKKILVLQHHWDGRPLQIKYAKETLRSLNRLWKNPIAILTKNNKKDSIYYCTNESVSELKRGEWLKM